MKHFGMTIIAAGLALTAAYAFGAQSVGWVEAGSTSCRYQVDALAGKSTMSANFVTSLDTSTPSGESTPDVHSLLRLNVSALDENCDNVTVQRMVFDLTATDNAASGWIRRAARSGITLEDVATGDVVAVGVPQRILGTSVRFATGSFSLKSGETRTLDVYVDMSGASAELDDTVQLSLTQNGTVWSDEHKSVRAMSEALFGSTVFF